MISETHEQWTARCRDNDIKCPVCGSPPNTFCTEKHLPHTLASIADMRATVDALARKAMSYTLAIAQEPKEGR